MDVLMMKTIQVIISTECHGLKSTFRNNELIYPRRMQSIADFFPFKYYLYAPAKFFTTGDVQFFAEYFPMQMMWFVIIGGVIWWMYARAVRRLEVNGG
jgi:ABC-type uncharacterized transport system permease subunit